MAWNLTPSRPSPTPRSLPARVAVVLCGSSSTPSVSPSTAPAFTAPTPAQGLAPPPTRVVQAHRDPRSLPPDPLLPLLLRPLLRQRRPLPPAPARSSRTRHSALPSAGARPPVISRGFPLRQNARVLLRGGGLSLREGGRLPCAGPFLPVAPSSMPVLPRQTPRLRKRSLLD